MTPKTTKSSDNPTNRAPRRAREDSRSEYSPVSNNFDGLH
jgi:hypothetical protein